MKNLLDKVGLLVLALARHASLLQPRHERHRIHLRQLTTHQYHHWTYHAHPFIFSFSFNFFLFVPCG